MYNKTLWSNKCFYSSFSKHQYLLSRYYSSMPEHRICSALLNNSGVRSYLDSLISKDYSDIMSKSNVSALILAIRSIRVDLQSLKEFDTGQYYNFFNIYIYYTNI
jgi:hypothetical protein